MRPKHGCTSHKDHWEKAPFSVIKMHRECLISCAFFVRNLGLLIICKNKKIKRRYGVVYLLLCCKSNWPVSISYTEKAYSFQHCTFFECFSVMNFFKNKMISWTVTTSPSVLISQRGYLSQFDPVLGLSAAKHFRTIWEKLFISWLLFSSFSLFYYHQYIIQQ